MRAGLAVSLIGHAALIAVGLVGLNSVQKLEPQEVEAIAIDLIPVTELASIRAGTERSTVIETEAPAVVDTPEPAQLAEPTGSTQQDQPRPEQTERPTPAPTVQTAPEPAPEPQPEPEPEPSPRVIEPAPEPEPVPAPKPAPEPVPEPVETAPQVASPSPAARPSSLTQKRQDFARKQEEARQADQVADLINTEESRGATTGTGGQASAGRPDGQAASLSNSELGVLIAQMQRCWNPTLSERSEGVIVQLRVTLNQDGTVAGMPEILSDITSPMVGLSARTAARKISACGPFNLPVEKYDVWQVVEVTLDASQAI